MRSKLHAVAAQVVPVGRVLDLRARVVLRDPLGDLADGEVLLVGPDVEDLLGRARGASTARRNASAASCTCRCGRHCLAPLTRIAPCAVAQAVIVLTIRSKRMRGETPQTVARRRMTTSTSPLLEQQLLGHDARARIERYRIEVRVLVQQVVAVGAVHAAGGGEHQTLDLGRAASAQHLPRRLVVDRHRPFGLEIAGRIADDRRQRHDRVHARQSRAPGRARRRCRR